jgi:hypothetical protein
MSSVAEENLLARYGNVGDLGGRAVPPARSSRRRPRDPSTWKLNNPPQKALLPPAACECEKECLFSILSQEEALSIQSAFGEQERAVRRQVLFGSLLTQHSTGGQRLKVKYIVLHPERGLLELCRKAFVSLYSTTAHQVKTLLKEKCTQIATSPSALQFSGESRKGPRQEALVKQVMEHIRSFPVEENHYGREYGGTRSYLASELSVAKMHRLYMDKYEAAYVAWEQQATAAKEANQPVPAPPVDYQPQRAGQKPRPHVLPSYYREIFVSKFNLAFGRPINELCGTCHNIANKLAGLWGKQRMLVCEGEDDCQQLACECDNCLDRAVTEHEIRAMEIARKEHIAQATLGYDTMRHDKLLCETTYKTLAGLPGNSAAAPYVETVFMDFEKNYHCPVLKVPQWYYARNFNLYNLGIYCAKRNHMKCLVFGQDMAEQGQDATYSLLLHHLYEVERPGDWLILWTDSCGRQNKHYMAVHIMQSQIIQGRRRRIDLKVPNVGHSFLPCDRIFGLIEKRRHLKQVIYVPEQWKPIVEGAAAEVTSVDIGFEFVDDISVFKALRAACDATFSTDACRKIIGGVRYQKNGTFAWPMVKISEAGSILVSATSGMTS